MEVCIELGRSYLSINGSKLFMISLLQVRGMYQIMGGKKISFQKKLKVIDKRKKVKYYKLRLRDNEWCINCSSGAYFHLLHDYVLVVNIA